MSVLLDSKPSPETVVAKAVLNAAKQLDLSDADLGAVIGIDRSGVSRIRTQLILDPKSKKGELALLLIRISRALYALTNGDKEWMVHFMKSHNKVTGGIPAEQVKTISGLMAVLQFVDAIRGKV